MFRQVLYFIYVWNRRSGTKGIVNFSLDPIVYKLQKANRESFEFCWMSKLLQRREKSLRFAVCKKTPAQFFKFEKKHLSLFLRSGFMFSWKSRSHRVTKNLRKAQNAGEPMPDFPKMTENTCRIFPSWESQKGHWGWKKIGPPSKKNV
jgi:hypothetical protein